MGATYTSNYVTFVTVEQADRNDQPLQTATTEETSLLTTYDTGGTIPFVDIGNTYAIRLPMPAHRPSGSAIPRRAALQLDADRVPAQQPEQHPRHNIDGAANRLISAICKIDGGAPTRVCSQNSAQTLSYLRSLRLPARSCWPRRRVLTAQAPSVKHAVSPTSLP